MPLPRGNRLLDGLPDADTGILMAHAHVVHLRAGDATNVQRMPMLNVDFPIDALMSVEGTLENGSTYELASVGNEAFVEIDAALDSNVALRSSYCQFDGRSVRVTIEDFQTSLLESRAFAQRVRHAVRARVFVTEQNQMCNLKHALPQRLARWLLVTRARLEQSRLGITHERLAMILGTRRATITEALADLERSGAIDVKRAEITLLDAAALKRASCECFELCREAIETSLSPA